MPVLRPRSLRQLLGVMNLLLALPLLALAAAAGHLQVRESRLRLEAEAHAEARCLLRRSEHLLAQHLAELRTAAGQARQDDVAKAFAALRGRTGFHLALLDLGGTPLSDTRGPDAPLPDAARAAALRLAATGRLVSPLVQDPASGGPALLLAEHAGGHILVMAVPAAELQPAAEDPTAATARCTLFAGLLDSEGRLVVQGPGAQRRTGDGMGCATPAGGLAPPVCGGDTGSTGLPAMVVQDASALSGLSAGIAISNTAWAEPYWKAALLIGPVVLLLLGSAATVTLLVAQRISRPMAQLGVAAAALAEGRPPPPLETPVSEVNAVAAALAAAAQRRHAIETQRDLLVRELHHRVKNLLTTAQSLAALSARTARDPAGFAAQFGERLRALAHTHTMLLEEPGGELELGALVREVLAPYRTGLGRITISGGAVRLPAEAAVPVGMVLHELATNATKHGALSVPEGQLRIAWEVRAGPRPLLVLAWTEHGGPRLNGPPERIGFGSQLLRRALGGLPGNDVQVDWREEGLAVRLALELREDSAATS